MKELRLELMEECYKIVSDQRQIEKLKDQVKENEEAQSGKLCKARCKFMEIKDQDCDAICGLYSQEG